MSIEPVKKMEIRDASEIAKHYGVPTPLVNMYFVIMNDKAYPMNPFLVHVAQKKGVQRMELTKPKEVNGVWECECKIYPKIPDSVIKTLPALGPAERMRLIDYYTAPTVEWGRASKENVRMSTMHQWLPEMAITRAVNRCCRKFSGVDGTTYEELPEAELSSETIKEAQQLTLIEGPKK